MKKFELLILSYIAMVLVPSVWFACAGTQTCKKLIKKKAPTEWKLFGENTWEEVPILWSFECSFPKAHKDTVRHAFKYWDDMTSFDLFLEVRSCFIDFPIDTPFIVVSAKNVTCPRTERCSNIIAEAYRPTCGDTYYCTTFITFWKPWFDYFDTAKLPVAIHEIGHILGMDHVPRGDCIMYFSMSQFDWDKRACAREIKEFKERYERLYAN